MSLTWDGNLKKKWKIRKKQILEVYLSNFAFLTVILLEEETIFSENKDLTDIQLATNFGGNDITINRF